MLELVHALVDSDVHAKFREPRSIRYEVIVRKRPTDGSTDHDIATCRAARLQKKIQKPYLV